MHTRLKAMIFWFILMLSLSIGACSTVEGQDGEPQDFVEPEVTEENTEPDEALPSMLESESGVEGYLWIGPTCPVVHEGTECPDEPYETTFTITDIDAQVVAIGKSDVDGFFHIPLLPGSYVFVPESGKPGVMPVAEPVPFDVDHGSFTYLEITYDSGMR